MKKPTSTENSVSFVLTSHSTFTMKYVLPFVWIVGGGLSVFESAAQSARFADGRSAPVELAWLWFWIWAISSVLVFFTSLRLKKVAFRDRRLVVSNYFKEICVEPWQISEIAEMPRLRGRPVLVTFSEPTAFGTKILLLSDSFSPGVSPGEVLQAWQDAASNAAAASDLARSA